MKKEINIDINLQTLDQAIEKANQLKLLLQEVKQLISSLSKSETI